MSNTNTDNNIKDNSLPPEEKLWYGGYKGGMLCWGSIRKQSQYIRRLRKKDNNEVIHRILSTRIDP